MLEIRSWTISNINYKVNIRCKSVIIIAAEEEEGLGGGGGTIFKLTFLHCAAPSSLPFSF